MNNLTPTSPPVLRVGKAHLLPRDLSLLADVFDSRFITIPHAARLHFPGLKSAERSANRRLQRMAGAGLLKREEGYFGHSLSRDGTRREVKTIYRFTKSAFDLLIAHGLIRNLAGGDWSGSVRKRFEALKTSTLAHEVGMLDIKAALRPAIDACTHLSVGEFGVWPLAYTFSVPGAGTRVTLRPDGFLHVREHRPAQDSVQHHFFYLEFDRGTEQHRTLVEKVQGYRHHLHGGGFLQWLGVGDAKPRDYPFRVLFVVDTPDAASRRDNIAATLARLGVQTHTPITTLAELVSDPLGCIWVTPRTYALAPESRTGLFEGLSTVCAQTSRSPSLELMLD